MKFTQIHHPPHPSTLSPPVPQPPNPQPHLYLNGMQTSQRSRRRRRRFDVWWSGQIEVIPQGKATLAEDLPPGSC